MIRDSEVVETGVRYFVISYLVLAEGENPGVRKNDRACTRERYERTTWQ